MENENNSNLDVLHCILFVYKAFAFATDAKFDEKESESVYNSMYRWCGEDQDLLKKVDEELKNWSSTKDFDDPKTIINVMISMVEYIKSQEDFDIYRKEYFLMDIRNIARADGVFNEPEKIWHDLLSRQLGCDIRVSQLNPSDVKQSAQEVKSQPVGFKMSWEK